MSPAQTATLAADSITLAHRQFTVAENLSVTLPTGKVTAWPASTHRQRARCCWTNPPRL